MKHHPEVYLHALLQYLKYLLHVLISHPQVVDDEDLVDQEYEDDFEVKKKISMFMKYVTYFKIILFCSGSFSLSLIVVL